jgi:hypothetical protein
MYKKTAHSTHYLPRTGSHATKGNRRGFVRDDFVELERRRILAERDILLELRQACRKKCHDLYSIGGQHEKAQKMSRINSRFKKAHKALEEYSFLISEYVDRRQGDHRTLLDFERARKLAQNVKNQVHELKQLINAV